MLIDGDNAIQQAFLSGRCDVYVSDGSQIAGFRFQQGARADELTILPERISSEIENTDENRSRGSLARKTKEARRLPSRQ